MILYYKLSLYYFGCVVFIIAMHNNNYRPTFSTIPSNLNGSYANKMYIMVINLILYNTLLYTYSLYTITPRQIDGLLGLT